MTRRRRRALLPALGAVMIASVACGDDGVVGPVEPTAVRAASVVTTAPSVPVTAVRADLVVGTTTSPPPSPATFPVTTTVVTTTAPPVPPATSAASPTPHPGAARQEQRRCLSAWSIVDVAAQTVWPAVPGESLADEASRFAGWGVGGVVLMSWPPDSEASTLQEFKTSGRIPMLVATDEEGGRVQRFRTFGRVPAPAAIPASMSPADAELMIADHGRALRSAGVDVVLGPVADVGGADGPMVDRVFSGDADVVGEYTDAYLRGWRRAGIMPVLKHFPGHGGADNDSHRGVAVTAPFELLEHSDLQPYTRSTSTDPRLDAGVMVGHLDVPGLTGGEPASLSSAAITDLLRDQLGFRDHLVLTDDLGMGAISSRYPVGEAAVRAVRAGADVVLLADASATPEVVTSLVGGVETGLLPRSQLDSAVLRILARKGVDACNP